MTLRTPRHTLFPYTTLFRSSHRRGERTADRRRRGDHGPGGGRRRRSGVHVGGARGAAPREWGAGARARRLVPALPGLLPLLSSSTAATGGTRGARRDPAAVVSPEHTGTGYNWPPISGGGHVHKSLLVSINALCASLVWAQSAAVQSKPSVHWEELTAADFRDADRKSVV